MTLDADVKTANAVILWDKISLTYHSITRITFSILWNFLRTTMANNHNLILYSRKSRETMITLWFLKKKINNTQNHNNSLNHPTLVVLHPSITTTTHPFLSLMLLISCLFSANFNLSNPLHSLQRMYLSTITITLLLLLTHSSWKTPSHSQQFLLMEQLKPLAAILRCFWRTCKQESWECLHSKVKCSLISKRKAIFKHNKFLFSSMKLRKSENLQMIIILKQYHIKLLIILILLTTTLNHITTILAIQNNHNNTSTLP